MTISEAINHTRRASIWLSLLVLLTSTALAGPAQSVAARPAPATSAEASAERVAERVDAIIASPDFRAARIGVKAVAADTGEVLYEHDPDRLFVPASNMKLYSTALGLTALGPEYRWRTSVYGAKRPTAAGRLEGDLIVYGRGDPTISGRFSPENPLAKLEQLADRVAAAGVKRVTGDLIADESYFTGERLGYGWEWNAQQWSYGAEISALSVNDNAVKLRLVPGTRPGSPVVASIEPEAPHIRVLNRVTTSAPEQAPKLGVYRAQASNVVEVWGSIPAGAKPVEINVAAHDPAALFGHLFRQALARRGVAVAGKVVSIDARDRETRPFDPAAAVELAWIEGDPLSAVVRETNKRSQNLYAELLLRTAGRVKGPADAPTTEAAGTAALAELLARAGAEVKPLVLNDGSGLGRRNLVTPDATIKLLQYMKRQPTWAIYSGSLPVAGVDGTLENRFDGTAAEGRVRAKTGTLDQVSGLSGILTARSGREVLFTVFVNNQPPSLPAPRQAVDAITLALLDL